MCNFATAPEWRKTASSLANWPPVDFSQQVMTRWPKVSRVRSILPCLLTTLSYLSSSDLFLKNRATASEASSLLLTECPLLLLHFQENSTQLLRMSLNLNSPCLFLTFCLHFYIPPFTKASSHKPGWGGANSDLCWAPSWETGKENKLGLQIILYNKQTPVGNWLWQHYNWACEWPPKRCLSG